MIGTSVRFKVVFADGNEVTGKTLPIDYLMAERNTPDGCGRMMLEMAATLNALKRQGVAEYNHLEEFVEDLADYFVEQGPAGNAAAPSGAPESQPSPTKRVSRSKS